MVGVVVSAAVALCAVSGVPTSALELKGSRSMIMSRRAALRTPAGFALAVAAAPAFALAVTAAPAFAAADPVLVRGTVSIAGDAAVPPSAEAALYITVKKGAQPQQIVGLMKGTPAPSVAAIRIPVKEIKSFPHAYEVKLSDLFADAPADLVPGKFALTVSARLDDDGVAATRGANDLVGSVFISGEDPAIIELKGRGAALKGVMQ